MNAAAESVVTLELEPVDNERLANLCGHLDEHLRLIERRLGVSVSARGNLFSVEGDGDAVRIGCRLLERLYRLSDSEILTPAVINLHLQQSGLEEDDADATEIGIRTRRGLVRGRGPNQRRYLQRIGDNVVNFGVGPAGTGKTFLAVACAVDALESDRVQRIVLVRPAVEAGERLGFLPGDLAQKVDPYLRPLHDALYEMLGFERAARLTERNVIEVAPLAYMRGRSLNDAFVILDEAQNTTSEQMKMFLTRIGFGSKAVITGDLTQIDLPPQAQSGLRQAIALLRAVEGVSTTFFDARDVVRHPIVRRIVEAYESASDDNNN
ncbi:MAG: PhoH family protein [Pseudomonadota bacterium]|nr:MAG: PhoH family protein [Pseudomonadota bacterium]